MSDLYVTTLTIGGTLNDAKIQELASQCIECGLSDGWTDQPVTLVALQERVSVNEDVINLWGEMSEHECSELRGLLQRLQLPYSVEVEPDFGRGGETFVFNPDQHEGKELAFPTDRNAGVCITRTDVKAFLSERPNATLKEFWDAKELEFAGESPNRTFYKPDLVS